MYRQEVSAIPAGQRASAASVRDRGTVRGMEIAYPVVGYAQHMVTKALLDLGVRGSHLHLASLGSVGLCIGLWIRAKTVDQDERGNAERRAIFVGLWAPTIWLIGNSLESQE